MDVSLGEFVQNSDSPPWLTAFRLLSKLSPGLAEVGIRMSSLSELERDYAQELLYPPTPGELADRRRERSNPTLTMYGSLPSSLAASFCMWVLDINSLVSCWGVVRGVKKVCVRVKSRVVTPTPEGRLL